MHLHPRATPLPFAHQGPFVTTADGAILCFDEKHAHRSVDEGVTWKSFPLFSSPEKFKVSGERALVCTREGTLIAAWINLVELQRGLDNNWGGSAEEFAHWILPNYLSRSHDHGRTWDEPILINRPWCGCVHSMIQTRTGRIVLVGQEIIPAWRHATVMFFSDDEGATWKRSNVLDIGHGEHDHAGSCEGTVIERSNGFLYLLLRTEMGYLYESMSRDNGYTWREIERSKLHSVTCCAQMETLSDGTVALLWNPPPRYDPTEPAARDELAIAFSETEGRSWSNPTIIAADYPSARPDNHWWRVSYPYLYERSPGELWITTMQGDLRIKIDRQEINQGSIPLPPIVVMFGDSTIARRPGAVKTTSSQHLQAHLLAAGLDAVVSNGGVPANNTEDAIARLESDVLALKPRLVVMQFGINDAAIDVWSIPPATGPRVKLEKFIANFREMITRLQAQGSAVVLMTTNPMYWSPILRERYSAPPYNPADPESFNRIMLNGYNAAVRDLAAELSLPLVDINAAYVKSNDPTSFLLPDGHHPADAGHKLLADLLAPVVIDLLKG